MSPILCGHSLKYIPFLRMIFFTLRIKDQIHMYVVLFLSLIFNSEIQIYSQHSEKDIVSLFLLTFRKTIDWPLFHRIDLHTKRITLTAPLTFPFGIIFYSLSFYHLHPLSRLCTLLLAESALSQKVCTVQWKYQYFINNL